MNAISRMSVEHWWNDTRKYRSAGLTKGWRVLGLNPGRQRFSRPIQDGPVLTELSVKWVAYLVFREKSGRWLALTTHSHPSSSATVENG
jgi:hypothetical protein